MRSKNWLSVVKIPQLKINKTFFTRSFFVDFDIFLKKMSFEQKLQQIEAK
jgi:hypothetical protein